MQEKIKIILEHIVYSLWAGFLFFGIPLSLYYLVKWDPILERGEYGEPKTTLGMLIIVGMYWVGLVLILKYRAEIKDRKRQIKELLNGTISEGEKAILERELKLEE